MSDLMRIKPITDKRIQFLGSYANDKDFLGFVTYSGKLMLHYGDEIIFDPSFEVFEGLFEELGDYRTSVFRDLFDCIFLQVPWDTSVLAGDRAKFRLLLSKNPQDRKKDLNGLWDKYLNEVHDGANYTPIVDDIMLKDMYSNLIKICEDLVSQRDEYFSSITV